MELAPGLHSLHVPIEDGSFFFRHYPPNSYLLTEGEGALIDTGNGDDNSINSRLDQLKELGNPASGTSSSPTPTATISAAPSGSNSWRGPKSSSTEMTPTRPTRLLRTPASTRRSRTVT